MTLFGTQSIFRDLLPNVHLVSATPQDEGVLRPMVEKATVRMMKQILYWICHNICFFCSTQSFQPLADNNALPSHNMGLISSPAPISSGRAQTAEGPHWVTVKVNVGNTGGWNIYFSELKSIWCWERSRRRWVSPSLKILKMQVTSTGKHCSYILKCCQNQTRIQFGRPN